MKKFTHFAFLSVLFLPTLLTGCLGVITGGIGIAGIFAAILVLAIIITIAICVPLFIARKKRDQKGKAQAEAEIANQKETPMKEFLIQNGLEQYCDIFKQNKIETLFSAIELTDSDLLNMGISTLADRKKLASLLAEKLSASKGPRNRCPYCGSTDFQWVSFGGSGENKCKGCGKGFIRPKWS